MSEILEILVETVKVGGNRALELQQELLSKPVLEMGRYRGDFKTRADDESQQLIIAILQQHYPSIPIIAEEQDNPQVNAATYFMIDPLDATWIYAHGHNEWGANAGYVKEGVLVAAVQYLPAKSILVTAEKNKGCSINGKPVHLNHDKPLKQSILHLVRNSAVDKRVYDEVCTPLAYESLTNRDLSSCIGGTLEVLQGKSHAFMNWHGFIWDYVGALAVEEAGGVALAFDGSPLRWDRVAMGVLFAASTSLAEEIIAFSQKAKIDPRIK